MILYGWTLTFVFEDLFRWNIFWNSSDHVSTNVRRRKSTWNEIDFIQLFLPFSCMEKYKFIVRWN